LPVKESPTFFFVVYCELDDQGLITSYLPPWGMSRETKSMPYVHLIKALGLEHLINLPCPPWSSYPRSSFAVLDEKRVLSVHVPGGKITATEVVPQYSASAVIMPISTAVGLPGGKEQALNSR
jgi:hypothetical protein